MRLHCSVLTTFAQIETHRGAWEDLLGRSAADGPMLSPIWLLSWWRIFGGLDGRRMVVALFHDGERLVGLAPLVGRTYRHRPGIPFRRLELLGTGEPEADEVCSEHMAPIAERGRELDVAAALAEALGAGALGPWDELFLGPMDDDNPVVDALRGELSGAGAGTTLTAGGPSYYVDLPSSYAEYTARLSRPARYLLTRSVRDFERWAGPGVELRVAVTPEEIEEGKRVLLSLHGERWGGGGVFASERFRAFHDEVIAAFAARGALELMWITARGEPFAVAYNFVWGGRVHYYQSGRRTDVPKHLRPGIVLLARALERAIAAGRREFDFFAGEYRYKRELGNGNRQVVTLRAVRHPDGARERARRLAERGIEVGRAARAAMRRPVVVVPGRETSSVSAVVPEDAVPAVLHGDVNMLRCFVGSGVRTTVLSSDPDAPSFFSRHCGQRRLVSEIGTDPAGALADLVALGKLSPDRPVLFYGDDAALLLVSRHRDELGGLFRFSLPPADRVEALVDKVRFAALAKDLSLPVPRTVASTELRSAAAIAAEIPLPVVIKPFCHLGFRTSPAVLGLGVGPAKVLRAATVEELAHMLARMESFSTSYVVQEDIPGAETQVFSFHAYLDAGRRVLGHYAGRKIRTYPSRAGVSTYLEIVSEPELTRQGLEALERLGITGVVKLDYKRDARTGRFYLLEVNPRYNLWNHLGAAAGVNLPLLAYRDLAGLPVEPAPPAKPGLRWLSLADDARTVLRDLRPAGAISLPGWIQSLRGPKVYDLFAWGDAWPFFMNLRRKLGTPR